MVFGVAVAPAQAAGDGHVEFVRAQPMQTGERFGKGVLFALFVVQIGPPMIEANAERELLAVCGIEFKQCRLDAWAHHRLHGVGEDEHT